MADIHTLPQFKWFLWEMRNVADYVQGLHSAATSLANEPTMPLLSPPSWLKVPLLWSAPQPPFRTTHSGSVSSGSRANGCVLRLRVFLEVLGWSPHSSSFSATAPSFHVLWGPASRVSKAVTDVSRKGEEGQGLKLW